MPVPGPTSETSETAAEETLRREAERILLSSAARLIGVLHRVAGETGLALGFAFRDIVLDREMPPTSWPLADVLDLLASHARAETATQVSYSRSSPTCRATSTCWKRQKPARDRRLPPA